MEILCFDERYIETAHCFALRTGYEILKGEFQPKAFHGYCIFGANKQVKVLNEIQKAAHCSYVIINDLKFDNTKGINPEYYKLLEKNLILEQDISIVPYLESKKITSTFFVNEFFKNESVDERTIKFIYNQGITLTQEPESKLIIQYGISYSVNQLTSMFCKCQCYLSFLPNDWLNINKAIACGCKVISCLESPDMMDMYSPFVLFLDDFDLITEQVVKELPEPDFKKFQDTMTTYSLNLYLPLIKVIQGICDESIKTATEFLENEVKGKESSLITTTTKP